MGHSALSCFETDFIRKYHVICGDCAGVEAIIYSNRTRSYAASWTLPRTTVPQMRYAHAIVIIHLYAEAVAAMLHVRHLRRADAADNPASSTRTEGSVQRSSPTPGLTRTGQRSILVVSISTSRFVLTLGNLIDNVTELPRPAWQDLVSETNIELNSAKQVPQSFCRDRK